MEHTNIEHHGHDHTEHHGIEPVKQNGFFYAIARVAAFFTSKLVFRRKFLRNEIKGKKGPFVIIANHQCAYDFVNLIGATSEKMTFVISQSFYNSVPVKGVISGMGVIPKQQFQTSLKDLKSMKAVIDNGRILAIYPAGLMCEDGLSTPIPETTYKFLQWLKADVYMARTYGTYFAMPKWTKGLRSGRTYMDIYKLFSKDEIEQLTESEVRDRAEEALLFDAYREQEKLMVKYKNGSDIRGLENVLYVCPSCGREFSMRTDENGRIMCDACGFEHTGDEYGFLHNTGEGELELRYVSDWSRKIYSDLKRRIESGEEGGETLEVELRMLKEGATKFEKVGRAEVTLDREHFYINGIAHGEELVRTIPIHTFASLPFSPGKHFELQHGEEIFRCVPDDPRVVMRFVNKVKIFHELSSHTHHIH